jgi:hypothetical protein
VLLQPFEGVVQMKLKFRKTTIIAFITLIFFTTLIGFYCENVFPAKTVSEEKVNELHTLFKTYDGYPPDYGLLSDEIPKMDHYIKLCNLIIVGEIIEELDKFKLNSAGEINTPERAISDKLAKNGVIDNSITFSQARVKVLDTIKGEKLSEIIIMRNSQMDDYDPPFTPGQKALLLLANGRGALSSKYYYSRRGYYFVTKDNLVVSAVSAEEYDKYTGMRLSGLIKEIRKYINN